MEYLNAISAFYPKVENCDRSFYVKILHHSFEDFLNVIRNNEENSKSSLCDDVEYMTQFNNRVWYDEWIKISRRNKYSKYNSKVSYYHKFINEWKQVGSDPYTDVSKDCLDRNCQRGHLFNVKYLISRGIKPDELTLNNCAFSGNFDLFKFIFSLVIKVDRYTLEAAASSGNLDLVEFIIDKVDDVGCGILYFAIRSCNVDLLKFLMKRGIKLDEFTIDFAALSGDKNMFDFVYSQDITPTSSTLKMASRGGNIDIVKFLINLGFAPNHESLEYSLLNDNMDLYKFIKSTGIPPNKDTLKFLIENHVIDLLSFLVKDECVVIDDDIIEYAMRIKNKEIFNTIFKLKVEQSSSN